MVFVYLAVLVKKKKEKNPDDDICSTVRVSSFPPWSSIKLLHVGSWGGSGLERLRLGGHRENDSADTGPRQGYKQVRMLAGI